MHFDNVRSLGDLLVSSPLSGFPDRLMIFIDGQNLLYACQKFASRHGRSYKFHCEETNLEHYLIGVQPNRKHIQTRFYTAIVQPDPERGQKDIERYERQLKKQRAYETTLKWYVFSKKIRAYPFSCPHCRWSGIETAIICQKCGNTLKEVKNKGVDVALATDLLVYGMSDASSSYDVAMLVSGDNDFIPVIQKLKDRRPQVKVEVAQFNDAIGFDMKQAPEIDKIHSLDNCADKIGTLYQKAV